MPGSLTGPTREAVYSTSTARPSSVNNLGFCRVVWIAAIARHHGAPERGRVLGKVVGDGGPDELARIAAAEHLHRVLVDLLDDEHFHAALREAGMSIEIRAQVRDTL